MITFELDPNTVRPGWTALIVVIVLAVIMVGLFFSMMRQMRKIKVKPSDAEAPGDAAETPDPPQPEDSEETRPEQDRSHRHDSTT
jgi:hypothetical protein